MTKHEAEATARQMEAAGLRVTGFRRYDRGSWAVDATDPQTGIPITVDTVEQWAERSNGATPQPGARLKYPELGATAQHSVTLPESCWQDIEALGVNPKGKNVRSEQLQAIRARRDAITPGVWGTKAVDNGGAMDELQIVSNTGRGSMFVATVGDVDIADVQADAAFIAAAPADVDTLLAMVDAVTAERDALAQQLQQAQDAAKRQAAYISACVDSDGCYRP